MDISALIEMGFDNIQIDRVINSGCRTVEEALDLIFKNARHPDRLVLRDFSKHSAFNNDMITTFDSVPQSTSIPQNEIKNEENVHSRFDKNSRDEQLNFERTEVRKRALEIRKDRIKKEEEKRRLMSEIKSDREAMKNRSVTQEISPPSCSYTSISTPDENININVHIHISKPNSHTLKFGPNDKYSCFLEKIQLILNNVKLDADSNECQNPENDDVINAYNSHVQNLRLGDSCVQIILNDWPRRNLISCSLNVDNEDQDSPRSVLNQTLSEIGLKNGCSVSLNHVDCVFKRSISQNSPLNHQFPIENPVANVALNNQNDFPSDEDNDDDLRFPAIGRRLVLRPPGEFIPNYRENPREEVRRTASFLLEHLVMCPIPDKDLIKEDNRTTTTNPVPSLTQLCFNFILNSLDQIVTACTDVSGGLIGIGGFGSRSQPSTVFNQTSTDATTRGCPRITNILQVFRNCGLWPEPIGRLMITELCNRQKFNAKTAVILKNCVACLNLNYYELVTSDLIHALACWWPDLHQLHLNQSVFNKLSKEAVSELRYLRNLETLSLNGCDSVQDSNLIDLISLSNLTSLDISKTKVTNQGWLNLANQKAIYDEQAGVTDPCSIPNNNNNNRTISNLKCLKLNSMYKNLNDDGLLGVVYLFPNLQKLEAVCSGITGSSVQCANNDYKFSSKLTNLNNMVYLNLMNSTELSRIPDQLIPNPNPIPAKTRTLRAGGRIDPRRDDKPGLRWIKIEGCFKLDSGTFVDQLKDQPIVRIDGIDSLPTINADVLLKFISYGFPLSRFSLRNCNYDWMTVANGPDSTSPLEAILDKLSGQRLVELCLPQRPIMNLKPDYLNKIGQLTNLETLDFGSQLDVIWDQVDLDRIRCMFDRLPRLKTVIAICSKYDFENELLRVCSQFCRIHVKKLTSN